MGKKKKKAASRSESSSAAKKKKNGRKKPKTKSVTSQADTSDSASAGATPYSVRDYMAKVEEYLDCFQVEMAVKFCERALKLEPDNLEVIDTLAPLLLEAGDGDRAFELFQRAVSLSPEQGATKYLYLGEMSEGQEAIGHLTKGIELLSRESEECGEEEREGKRAELSSAYCALAEVYLTDVCFESDAGQRCYDCCCQAVELSPSNPEAHQVMANCLLSQQLPEKAKEALMKGVLLWLPSRQKKEGQEAAAVGGASETDIESANLPSYSSRIAVAKLLLELEEYDLAFEVLEGLLCEDEEVVSVWYLMGWLHHLTKDADSARFYLEQMLVLYSKLGCDEEDLLAHAQELLAELGPPEEPPGEGEEEEGPPGGGSAAAPSVSGSRGRGGVVTGEGALSCLQEDDDMDTS